MSVTRWLAVLGILAICVASEVNSCQGQNRLQVTAQSSRNAERLLNQILQDLSQNQTPSALTGLQTLHQRYHAELIQISPTFYLRGDFVLACVIGRFDEQQREQLRLLTGRIGVTSAVYEETDFLNPKEAWALSLLRADEFWRQGKIDNARRNWRLLDDSPRTNPVVSTEADWRLQATQTDLLPDALTRFILSDLVVGDVQSAERGLKRFQELFPERQGHLAGKTGVVLDLLKGERAHFQNHPTDFYQPSQVTPPAAIPVRVDLSRFAWSVPLTENFPDSTAAHVGLIDDAILVNDSNGVRALASQTGKTRWPVSEADKGYLIESTEITEAPKTKVLPGIRHNNLWIALHSDLTLHAYDMTAEGLLSWKYPDVSTDDQTKWTISGSGVLSGETMIVPERSSAPDQQFRLACIDGNTGTLLWTQVVGSVLIAQPEHILNDQLTLGVKEVFWNINGTAVACHESDSGTLRWIRGLDSESQLAPLIHSDIQYHQEQVLALSPGFLTSLNPDTGSLKWKTRLPDDVTQLIQVSDLSVVVSGHQLWGIDRDTGIIRWNVGSKTPADFGYGRGILLGRTMFWPTREELWAVDARTGRLLQRDFLMAFTGRGGGNLTISNSQLFIADDQELRAFQIHRRP